MTPSSTRWHADLARLAVRSKLYSEAMSTPDVAGDNELVVAEDGSIPAEQVARLGLRPGTHLRVIETQPRDQSSKLAGALPDFPDLDWAAFEIGSDLARRDLTST